MRILSADELKKQKGVRFSNVHRLDLEKRGKFPKRIRLGKRRYGYSDAEIDAWLEARAALREAAG